MGILHTTFNLYKVVIQAYDALVAHYAIPVVRNELYNESLFNLATQYNRKLLKGCC